MDQEKEIKAGDVVRLKSGGPMMIVKEVQEASHSVQCIWFTEGGAIASAMLPPIVLIKVN